MRRLRRPLEYEDFVDKLLKDNDKLNFTTNADVYALATMIGYYYKKRKPFIKTAIAQHWEYFSPDQQKMLRVLALVESNKVEILTEEQEKDFSLIIEEYACAGLEIMKNKLGNNIDAGINKIDAIFELLMLPLSVDNGNPENILEKMIKQ